MYCKDCDLYYPPVVIDCRACDGLLEKNGLNPPYLWEELAKAKVLERHVSKPIPFVGCAMRVDGDRVFLDAADLVRHGWSYPVPSFQLFEVASAHIVEVQGYDQKRKRYWVEVIGRSDGGLR